MKRWMILCLAPLFLICDFFLKKFVMSAGSVGDIFFHVHLLPFVDFDLAYVQNKGMAWGMFASFQPVIFVLRVILIGTLSLFLARSKKMQRHLFAFMLILLGAFGNILDTLMYGYVVDMLHFTFWGRSYGIFNIADAMIFLGAFIIIFSRERPHALKE